MNPAKCRVFTLWVTDMFRKRLSIYDHFYINEIQQAIDQTVHSERDRMIMRYKLVDGLTYEEIAEIPLPHKKYPEGITLTSRQIQNIVYKYERPVYGYLAELKKQSNKDNKPA